MTNLSPETETILPSAQDACLAQETGRKLAAHFHNQEMTLHLLDPQERPKETVELPAVAVRLLLNILAEIANGNAIQLTPVQANITTQQAADLLNVSHIYMTELLETGQISSHKVGCDIRVDTQELLTYKQQMDAKRLQALNELTTYDQELGLQ